MRRREDYRTRYSLARSLIKDEDTKSGEDWERLSHALFPQLILQEPPPRGARQTASRTHRREGILNAAHQRNDFAIA